MAALMVVFCCIRWLFPYRTEIVRQQPSPKEATSCHIDYTVDLTLNLPTCAD